MLPHCDASGAEAVADRLCEEFGRSTGTIGMPCTLSIGSSTSETSARLSLLTDADKALYRSKVRGGGHQRRGLSELKLHPSSHMSTCWPYQRAPTEKPMDQGRRGAGGDPGAR